MSQYPGVGWVDGPNGGTPLDAANLEVMDQGIADEDLRNPASPASLAAAALYGHDVRAWAPNTPYIAGQAVVSPSGDLVTAVAGFTSAVTYNAANWNLSTTYASGANFVPKWQPSTVYAAGKQVISPAGDVVSAATSHTSGASFSGFVSAGGNWLPSPTFDSTALANLKARLTTISLSDQAQSAGAARIAWEDSAQVDELFADMTNWSATGLTASSGTVPGTTGSPNNANRALSLASGEEFRLRTKITMVAGGATSTYTLIGVNANTAGATVTTAQAVGIGFRSDGRVFGYQGTSVGTGGPGGAYGITASAVASGDYYVTIVVDALTVSLALTTADNMSIYEVSFLRSALPGAINNVWISNGDARGASGNIINPLHWRRAITTIKPRTGVEGLAPGDILVQDANGQNMRVVVPASYDPRKPAPLVIFAHGASSDQSQMTSNSTGSKTLLASLLSAGFIVASSKQRGDNWGSPASQSDVITLYNWVKARYAISGAPCILAASMGTLTALNFVSHGRLPVSAVGIIDGVINLAWQYQNGTNGVTTDQAGIISAWGLAPDGSDYGTQTAGYDPLITAQTTPQNFRGIPMLITSSPDDTRVPEVNHANLFVPLVSPYGTVTHVEHSGAHTIDAAWTLPNFPSFFQSAIAAS